MGILNGLFNKVKNRFEAPVVQEPIHHEVRTPITDTPVTEKVATVTKKKTVAKSKAPVASATKKPAAKKAPATKTVKKAPAKKTK